MSTIKIKIYSLALPPPSQTSSTPTTSSHGDQASLTHAYSSLPLWRNRGSPDAPLRALARLREGATNDATALAPSRVASSSRGRSAGAMPPDGAGESDGVLQGEVMHKSERKAQPRCVIEVRLRPGLVPER